ncbi:transposase, partial [Candidatus Saccharibacteria bacterium]|nr:transposase [Candidatus Saccharibacteria bacterium]
QQRRSVRKKVCKKTCRDKIIMEKEKASAIVITDGKREIIRKLLSEYDIQTAQDIQEALEDLLGDTIKEMMEAEMSRHPGYEKSERSDSDNSRNGNKSKRVKSGIDRKIISMHGRGLSTRQISVINSKVAVSSAR